MIFLKLIQKKQSVIIAFYLQGMLFISIPSKAQVTATNTLYSFLELPVSAKITSLGGLNISSLGDDLGLAMYNPSLLSATMENQLHLGIKSYFAGIKQYDVFNAKYWEQKNITWGVGVHYVDYGNISMTDVSGNEIGTMHPNDYSIQASMATDYIPNIRIGSSLKYIHSNYGLYASSAIAMDVGLTYLSQNHLSQLSILVKQLGMQLGTISQQHEIPFNLIVGWTKKLAYAPIQFSLTADKLTVWDQVNYNPSHFLNHLKMGTEIFIGPKAELNFGYNIMRRNDLNVQDQSNGLNGFAGGFGLQIDRIKLQYGASFFQSNLYNHLSITFFR